MNDSTNDAIDELADRPATPDEAAAAAAAAEQVDVDQVGAHETEMNRIGANVKGEGEIEPSGN